MPCGKVGLNTSSQSFHTLCFAAHRYLFWSTLPFPTSQLQPLKANSRLWKEEQIVFMIYYDQNLHHPQWRGLKSLCSRTPWGWLLQQVSKHTEAWLEGWGLAWRNLQVQRPSVSSILHLILHEFAFFFFWTINLNVCLPGVGVWWVGDSCSLWYEAKTWQNGHLEWPEFDSKSWKRFCIIPWGVSGGVDEPSGKSKHYKPKKPCWTSPKQPLNTHLDQDHKS